MPASTNLRQGRWASGHRAGGGPCAACPHRLPTVHRPQPRGTARRGGGHIQGVTQTVEGSEAVTGPLEGGTLRPVAEGPRVSLHGVPCGRARLHRGGRDPPGPLVPCGLGGTWRVPVTCSKRPPKAAGPEGKARARMGVAATARVRCRSPRPPPAVRAAGGPAPALGMAGPEVTADAGWGPRCRPQGRRPSLGCCRFMPSSPFSSQASLVPAEPVPPQRRAAARDGPPGRTVPPGTCPLAEGQLGDHPRHSPTRTLPFVRSPSLSLLFRAQRWDT